MSAEGQEGRTVEVLCIPDGVDEDLLSMYFTNKRRSGGGPLVSLEKVDSRAMLVFEEAEAAARVLAKRPHCLRSVEMTVRRPGSKDPGRMLLRGVSRGTSQDMMELYVENMMGMEMDDYSLERLGGDLVLVHLHKPLSKDFQQISAKISNKPLDGSNITLEQIEQTDSILVGNLHPSINEDILTLYFESRRGGGREVKNVIMMAEGTAAVSFEDFESVEKVLTLPHRLEDTALTVKPYFSFLPLEQSLPSLTLPSLTVHSPTLPSATLPSPTLPSPTLPSPTLPSPTLPSLTLPSPTLPSATSAKRPLDSSPSIADDTERRERIARSPPTPLAVPSANGLVSAQTASGPAAPPREAEGGAEVTMEDLTVEEDAAMEQPPLPSSHISVPDPVKLDLLRVSPLAPDLRRTHPGFDVQITGDGVHLSGPEKAGVDLLRNAVLEFLGGIAQAHLTFSAQKAQFLADEEVKARLLRTLRDQGTPCVYSVTDCVVVVVSLSLGLVSQACGALKSLISEFSIPVDRTYECMLYSQEWSVFLRSLVCCLAQVGVSGGEIVVVTLEGMEDDVQMKIVEFLSTPIETEAVIPMELGMLKYIQLHHHTLLAEMDQVSILPLEDVCGLRIHGNAGACQMADEVLRGVLSSVCTRTITVTRPGVARFLVQEEGTGILAEMTAKFQVYISLEKVHWKPPAIQDIFEAAWKTTSHQNFQRVLLDGATKESDSTSAIGLIEEAKRLFSAMDESSDPGQASEQSASTAMEEEDLYTAAEPMVASPSDQQGAAVSSQGAESSDNPQPLVDGGEASGGALRGNLGATGGALAGSLGAHASNLFSNEDAQLSLAIQYSMENTKRSLADEEEELRKVLELSRNASSSTPRAVSQTNPAASMSLQDYIASTNTSQIFVFAGYSCDLIRTDIALGKKVTNRQVEEKVEHKGLRNLTEFHKRCVDVIKRKHAVELKIEGTTATVSGFKDYVDEALPDVKLLVRRVANATSDADILRTVQWAWLNPATSAMAPYAPEVTVFLENAYKMRQKSIDVLLNNRPHVINLERMLECDVASGKSVSIARKMLSTGDLFTELPEEDYSQLSSMPEASKLNEDTDEFQDVVKEFYDSISKYHNKIRIIKVEKLMNRLLYNQYRLKKASVSQSTMEPEVEQTLFHGTSEASAKEICVHGFNRSFCGKNATVYGQGVYFAVDSALSVQDQYSPPNADGYKFVFIAKVLTGDFTKGSHEMKTAPLKESSGMPLRYDSVTDDPNKPSLFVIFNDTQCFPEYLITCQKIHR